MPSEIWGREVAESYDTSAAEMFEPAVLGPAVDFLADLAGDGRALEFAIGTGRVALPLRARGVPVAGIELSPHMAEQLLAKPGADEVAVKLGSMTDARVAGAFRLVYLVWNSIMNVTTQDEQVEVFLNAAAHLEAGGCFVVEVTVPKPHTSSPGDLGRVFSMDDDHVGLDTYDDPVAQILSSHHWQVAGERLLRETTAFRYLWPSEMDLMARIAGLRLRERWANWQREPFSGESASQVAVYEKHLPDATHQTS
jgi:SAM-dependent methyltransferase